MREPNDSPIVADIFVEELERLARLAVDLRANRVIFALVPLGLVAILDLRPARLVVLALLWVSVLALSRYDRGRVEREGFSPGLVGDNAKFVLTAHFVLIATTGGLASPFLPVPVVFSLAISLLMGPGRALQGCLIFLGGLILLLAGLQILGLDRAISPDWLTQPLTLVHIGLHALVLGVMVTIASRIGLRLRALFELVLGRVALARAELLDSHRHQAEDLTRLSGEIAHELKNPLASIKGLAALMARDLPEGRPAERMTVLRGEVDRMQGILDEFLNFSRPLVPAVLGPTDLRKLCEEVVALHEGVLGARGLQLELEGEAVVSVDARKTKQILINIVQNAVDASPPSGRLRLRVRVDDGGAVVVVDDEGQGPAEPERVFEPGYTTKSRGSGLGLTIARGLARQQGGELTLERRPEGGGRATLRCRMAP